MPFTVIDLFAGAGGLSEGFSLPNFEEVAHVEMNEEACDTLRLRDVYHYLLSEKKLDNYNLFLQKKITKQELIKNISENVLDKTICIKMSKNNINLIIDQLTKALNGRRLDVLLGGPPCQAYSLVGRARTGRKKNSYDPRNRLYKLYLQILAALNPKVFVFENVIGLLSTNKRHYFNDMMRKFRACGYHVEYHIVNSHDYGVLQNRNRVLIIGIKDLDRKVDLDNQKIAPDVMKHYLVNDLLSDLPPLDPGKSSTSYATDPSEYLLHFGIRNPDDILTWHLTRPIRRKDRAIYKRVIRLWDSDHRHLQYKELPKNLKTHKNQTDFADRFKIVPSDGLFCQTMVAHIAKDGHYYIHPDINQARSISVREAARIQSFPDNFYFCGERTAAFTQIGNAVPPLVSKAVAAAVYLSLIGGQNGQNG